MNSKILFLAALAGCVIPATAKTLTPGEALERVQATGTGVAMKVRPVSGTTATPVYTARLSGSDTPALYVFTPHNDAGYMIVSADDIAAPVLGYSENGTFDADNIPESLRWWLSQYENEIAAAAKAGAPAYSAEKAAAAGRAPIAPMLKTLWNQDDPYNALCPTYYGQRAYVGCVATAMAQVMKYHNWPPAGEGQHSYTWQDKTYSMDFSTLNFDWDKMVDDYSGDYTDGEALAVAQLMYACGVSVNMQYSTSGSGASSADVAPALLNYFDYDPSIRYAERTFYTTSEWEDMIYNDLATTGPVYYSGNGTGGAHAFVCDGYSSDRYFHFNWGWGGMSDGYFRLSALDPTAQGIGGSIGGTGFSNDQCVVLGITPDKGGEKGHPELSMYYILGASMSGYSVIISGFFYNPGEETAVYNLGARVVNVSSGAETEIFDSQNYEIGRFQGMEKYSVHTGTLEQGTYRLYPIYKVNEQVYDMLTPSVQCGYVLLQKGAGLNSTVSVPSNMSDVTVDSYELPRPIYLNRPFEMSVTLTNHGDTDIFAPFYPVLFSASGTTQTLAATGDAAMLDIGAGETVTIHYQGSLTWNGTAKTGSYTLRFGADLGSTASGTETVLLENTSTVEVTNDPGTATLICNGWTVENPDHLNPDDVRISIDVECTGGYYSNTLAVFVFPETGGTSEAYMESPMLLLSAGDRTTVSFTGSFYAEDGEKHLLIPYYMPTNNNMLQLGTEKLVTIDHSAGIDNMAIDTEALTITPNPADGETRVKAASGIESIAVFSLSGAVLTAETDINGCEATLNVAGLPTGMYIVSVSTRSGETHAARLIKK